eukprot:CAMPEP_0116834672 /NCGR_PEP_ID=MMETSP0418-20121206/7118_1 /TAXON_ID=1158023 /ORGANISM="Astrosyne radiata, Strain 13vi08-1A" /LENGTH=307 /DNA_ID=CAMNT_0004464251 /DNA_START=73 /DNA_END=996 /DNA_ORIENTATION=+
MAGDHFTTVFVLLILNGAYGFTPISQCLRSKRTVSLRGYLDDLSKELQQQSDEPSDDPNWKEKTKLKKEDKDRFGPANWDSYVEFDEFDGGDGQMGVAGDGKKGLEKFGEDVSPRLSQSKMRSAKIAWGKTTGYADKLIKERGWDTQKAQQMENWHNQQAIRKERLDHVRMTEEFDKIAADEDWRNLSKFGIQRNQEFDFDAELGAVTPGDEIEGVIELSAKFSRAAVEHVFVKNEYMGFADFRAAIVPSSTSRAWTVSPSEGSLNKEPIDFTIKFRPESYETSEGYLVIETEDFKKTWKLVGSGTR